MTALSIELLNGLSTAVLVYSPDAQLIYANTRAKAYLGEFEDQLPAPPGDRSWFFMTEQGEVMHLDAYPANRVVAAGQPFENLVLGIGTLESPEPTWVLVSAFPNFDGKGDLHDVVVNFHDITRQKNAETALKTCDSALAALSDVNHLLVHAADESDLLADVCGSIVSHRGYLMAWVGYLEHDDRKTIRVVARAGLESDYIERAAVVWSDTARGRGPSGTAARTGETQVARDFLTSGQFLPWRSDAKNHGFTAVISLPLLLEKDVFGVLSIYSGDGEAFNTKEVSRLEEMAGDLSFGVRSLRTRHERDEGQKKIKEQLAKLEGNLEATISAISSIVEMRDPYTAGHEYRVALLAVAIATEMGLTDERIKGIRLGAMVHDVGKIQIPAEILAKPRRLTDIETKLVQVHPSAGYAILKDIDFPWPIALIVLQHHERLDGSGYPQGLKGDEVLLESRIVSVADVVESMGSHRPYRPALGVDMGLNEIRTGRGTLYDSAVVDACLRVLAAGKFTL